MRKSTTKSPGPGSGFSLLSLILSLFLIFSVTIGSPIVSGAESAGRNKPAEIVKGEEADEADDGGIITTDEKILPVGIGQVDSSDKEAKSLRVESGFDAFNAHYQNQWKATFTKKSGKVRILYGSLSKAYENGPESVARGFLKDSHAIFGLKPDLSDLKTQRVDRTPQRNHVRFHQTYRGIPIIGAQVLVHSNPEGRVTMVQNDYIEGFQVANGDLVVEEVARNIAQNDLQISLGTGVTLSEPKVEKAIIPRKGGYYYVWKIAIPTRNPWGYWVYHIDAENGAILYKGNEIQSLKTGKGRAYMDNAKWHSGIINNVLLKNMFTDGDGYGHAGGWLWGLHADIWDYNSDDPYSSTYSFYYDPYWEKDYFDATHAYYQMNTVWDWWEKMVIRKYGPYPAYFYDLSIPVIVNVDGMCNAFYTPDLGSGYPGFVYGDENSCAPGSEDLVIDNDIFRHEYTHAMMHWSGFSGQFGGDVNYYGRAMGEGNSDFFAFLYSPKDPLIGDVAWAWSTDGYLRNLDSTRMYPWDVDLPAWGTPEEHYTGEIWGGYLYDLYWVLKGKALPFVYQSFYYFSPWGGYMDGLPDFFDAIWAQVVAESDMTGKMTSSAKAWGSMASRGINGALRAPYSHSSDYFYTGGAGSDNSAYFFFNFPPVKSVNTKSNLLLSGDWHEYVISTTSPGLDLTALVTAPASNGLVYPNISLYTVGGGLLSSVGPSSFNKATLKSYNLPAGTYVVVVSGSASAPARGYYTFKLSAK